MPYAKKTKVAANRTRVEIEAMLVKNGARRFAYAFGDGVASIVFDIAGRTIRFNIPVPKGDDDKVRQETNRRWRALLLCVKAKLESVASDIETFDEAFLAHVVMPDSRTVYDHVMPRIAEIAKTGRIISLLAAPAHKGGPEID